MKHPVLLSIYNRFTSLAEKLPGGLQKPILREMTPIRELFLEQRPPRILLAGSARSSVPQILSGLGVGSVETGSSDNGWRTYRAGTRGSFEILDARNDVPDDHVRAGLARFQPDLILIFPPADETPDTWTTTVTRISGPCAPIAAIAAAGNEACHLQALLASETTLAPRILPVPESASPACVEALCEALPLPARLEFARTTGAKGAQAQIASSILGSFSAICGIIAVQPIPLADMPILTTIRTLMVGLIIHTSGRTFTLRLAAEFAGAMGINIGAGFLLREGARALVKVIPFWGNAISGFVAGTGTYAIGRAAIAYFIDDAPAREARKILLHFRSKKALKAPPFS